MNAPARAERHFAAWMLVIAAAALLVRFAYPTADPPWQTTVGVVWHDEGAWVHNARNKALFGAWSLDNWNPMYIAPVFSGLEYVSFAAFGVGVWQARLVSELTGFLSVLLLAFGVRRIAGARGRPRRRRVAGNQLRLRDVEPCRVDGGVDGRLHRRFLVLLRSRPRRPALGLACGRVRAARLLHQGRGDLLRRCARTREPDRARPTDSGRRRREPSRGARHARGAGRVRRAGPRLFVLPNWPEYRFYNWQMSVTRKPSYDLRSLIDRVTWFPIVHDIFTRMWFTVVVAVVGAVRHAGAVARGERRASGCSRSGSGSGRSSCCCTTSATSAGSSSSFPRSWRSRPSCSDAIDGCSRLKRRPCRTWQLAAAAPVVLYGLYVIVGAMVRLAYLYVPGPGVRLGAAVAVALCIVLVCDVAAAGAVARGSAMEPARRASSWPSSPPAASWRSSASGRSGAPTRTIEASVELGRILPPGTLVHGKLANGLSLENRIRPIFVGTRSSATTRTGSSATMCGIF